MDTLPITRALTKTAVILCFWFVFGFSMFLRNDLTLITVFFDFGKAVFVSGCAWFFLSIINDTLIKSLVDSAKEHHVNRYKGGLSYYLAEPSVEEKQWYREYLAEQEAEKNKIPKNP